MLALLVIKVLFHIGNFGWGFYVVLASALVLVYGAFEVSRKGSPASVHAAAHGSN